MKKIYHLKTCNTCQRIIGELNTDGVEMQEIKSQHINAEQLDWLKEKVGSYEALFNKRAQKYRQQGLNEKNLTETDYRDLILGEYTFLKRPVIVVNDEVFVGKLVHNLAIRTQEVRLYLYEEVFEKGPFFGQGL
jgi:arsenate reductase